MALSFRHLTTAVQPRASEIYGHTSLRGIAALSVVGYHAALIAQLDEGPVGPVGSFFLGSFIFVDLFFVLSGFIMVEAYGAALSAPQRRLADLAAYWRKRAAKILPNYYVWLLIAIVVYVVRAAYFGYAKLSNPCFGSSVAQHLLLLQTFMDPCVNFNTPLWSIVVEIVAYLCFPVLILVLRYWPVLCALSVVLYAGILQSWGTIDVLTDFQAVLRCLAGFMIGMSTARMISQVPVAALRWLQLPAFAGMLICVALDAQPAALVFIATTVLLTGRNHGPLVRVLRIGAFYLMGRASFSIYLAHVPVLAIANLVLSKIESETGLPLSSDWRIFVPICMATAAAVGVAAYFIIERRFEAARWLRIA